MKMISKINVNSKNESAWWLRSAVCEKAYLAYILVGLVSDYGELTYGFSDLKFQDCGWVGISPHFVI